LNRYGLDGQSIFFRLPSNTHQLVAQFVPTRFEASPMFIELSDRLCRATEGRLRFTQLLLGSGLFDREFINVLSL
jgi:hypothetical protein